jgi:catechol 2,3-dioxygenase-like lactoylglutathione lyase family enzyme
VNALPFESLDYLYLPAPDIDASVAFYTTVLGGELLWKIHDASTWVAAVRLVSDGPAVVLADHLAPGRGLLIYRVGNLADTQRLLVGRGWSAEAETVELPQGPCLVFHDPGGQRLAIYQRVRPGMDQRFAGRFDAQ